LDGENVGGTNQFVKCEDERGGISLPRPPFGHRVNMFEIGSGGLLHYAEDVEVRVLFVEVARDGGAVQDRGLQVVPRAGFQPFDQFAQLGLHARHPLITSLPTASGTPSAKTTSSAKTAAPETT